MDNHTKRKSNCVGLVILQWNCNGILAHQNELKKHIVETDKKYDVICLQETFLKSGKNLFIPGYNIDRCDRKKGGRGGVLTLIKNSINFTPLPTPARMECISIRIN